LAKKPKPALPPVETDPI